MCVQYKRGTYKPEEKRPSEETMASHETQYTRNSPSPSPALAGPSPSDTAGAMFAHLFSLAHAQCCAYSRHLVPVGPFWSLLVPFGRSWFLLVPFGSSLVALGSLWSILTFVALLLWFPRSFVVPAVLLGSSWSLLVPVVSHPPT